MNQGQVKARLDWYILKRDMQDTHPHAECCIDFAARHEQHAHPAMRELERSVLGCDYGGTSYTTKIQADEIPGKLGLQEGVSMLEIGSGSGWPGLYLARVSRCDATLLDIPLNALRQANERANRERLGERCRFVAANGAVLPFTTGSFEAIDHSDVLCCLLEKQEMLEECRRVACDGARMLFYVILPAPDLTQSELRSAIDAGPPFVEIPGDYASMLRVSGWQLLERRDVTESYLAALRGLVTGLETAARALQEALGEEEYFSQLARRHQQVDAVERKLLVRELFIAGTK